MEASRNAHNASGKRRLGGQTRGGTVPGACSCPRPPRAPHQQRRAPRLCPAERPPTAGFAKRNRLARAQRLLLMTTSKELCQLTSGRWIASCSLMIQKWEEEVREWKCITGWFFFLFLTRMHPTDPGSAGCVKGPLNVYFKIFTAVLETHLTWVSPGPGRSSNMFLSCDRRGNFDSILGDFFGQVRQNVFTGRHSSARQSKSEKNSKSLFAFVKIKSNCLCHIARFKLPIFNVLIDNRKNANR